MVVQVGLDLDGLALWPATASRLPASLRGPIAFVLFRSARDTLPNPVAARLFFVELLQEAAKAPRNSPLARAAFEELVRATVPWMTITAP